MMRTTETGLLALAMLGLSVIGLSAIGGCASTHELAVDVFTDYAPGVEFDEVAVRLDDGAWTTTPIRPRADLSDPAHMADYDSLAGGVHHVVAELRWHGMAIADGSSWVRLEESVLVPIPISRLCAIGTCPAPTNPTATECYGGECFVPMCDPAESSCMALACSGTRACPVPAPDQCIEIVCQRGACLRLPRDERCASDQYCEPASGLCVNLHETPIVTATPVAMTEAIDVSWSDVGGTSYAVELAASAAFDTATTTTEIVTGLTHRFTGLIGGHRYYVRVHATDPGGRLSDVASALTWLPAPTGLGMSVTYSGASRPSTDCCWILPTDTPGSGMYEYEVATASASCAYGSPQYAFRGGYTSPPDMGASGWQDIPQSFIENVTEPWGARFYVSARCVTTDGGVSDPTGEVTDCYTHHGPC